MKDTDQNYRILSKLSKFNRLTSNFLAGCLFREHHRETVTQQIPETLYQTRLNNKHANDEVIMKTEKWEHDGIIELIYLVVRRGNEKMVSN